jgi:hypothetical protein
MGRIVLPVIAATTGRELRRTVACTTHAANTTSAADATHSTSTTHTTYAACSSPSGQL